MSKTGFPLQCGGRGHRHKSSNAVWYKMCVLDVGTVVALRGSSEKNTNISALRNLPQSSVWREARLRVTSQRR